MPPTIVKIKMLTCFPINHSDAQAIIFCAFVFITKSFKNLTF